MTGTKMQPEGLNLVRSFSKMELARQEKAREAIVSSKTQVYKFSIYGLGLSPEQITRILNLSRGLSDSRCTHCYGLGSHKTQKQPATPCKCVLRKIGKMGIARHRGHVHASQTEDMRITFQHCEWNADFMLCVNRAISKTANANLAFIKDIVKYHLDYPVYEVVKLAQNYFTASNLRSCYHVWFDFIAQIGFQMIITQPYPVYPFDEYFSVHNAVERSANSWSSPSTNGIHHTNAGPIASKVLPRHSFKGISSHYVLTKGAYRAN